MAESRRPHIDGRGLRIETSGLSFLNEPEPKSTLFPWRDRRVRPGSTEPHAPSAATPRRTSPRNTQHIMEQNMREPQSLSQFGAPLTGLVRTPVSRIVRIGAVLAGTGALALGLLAAAPASAHPFGPASALVADERA